MRKKILRKINLSENYLSILLGLFVVVVLGFFIVNVFKKEPIQTKKGETSSTSTVNEEAVKKESPKTYTVQSGDDLWDISVKNYNTGYNWVDLAKANNITDPNMIYAGQKLVIPQVTPIVPQTNISSGEKGSTTASNVPEKYTIVHGDNLWTIAVKVYNNGYKWSEIAQANNLSDPNLIHAGNVLKLPRS